MSSNNDLNREIIDVFRMLTDRIDRLEDQITNSAKTNLQHFHTNRTGVCEGAIFDVHCSVVHLNGNEKVYFRDYHNGSTDKVHLELRSQPASPV